MKFRYKIISFLTLIFVSNSLVMNGKEILKSELRLAIVLPVEHEALFHIVKGFTDEAIARGYNLNNIKIYNAGGDVNIMRSMIQQAEQLHYDYILPVGKVTTLLTAQLATQTSIIGLAADISEQERQKIKGKGLTGINDELKMDQVLPVLLKVNPILKHVTLIYTQDDKVNRQVQEFKKIASDQGLNLDLLMVTQLSDIYMLMNQVKPNTDVLMLFKDQPLVSVLPAIVQKAKKLKKPIFALDEGSVLQGACFGFGVTESEIGKKGAVLMDDLVDQRLDIKTTPFQAISEPHLFLNLKTIKILGISDSERLRISKLPEAVILVKEEEEMP